MAVQSFAEAHAQIFGGQSTPPQLANPSGKVTLFQQAHQVLIQNQQSKPQVQPISAPKIATAPVQKQPSSPLFNAANAVVQGIQHMPLPTDLIDQKLFHNPGQTLQSPVPDKQLLPQAKQTIKTQNAEQFVKNIAGGVLNAIPQGIKSASDLGTSLGSKTATPQNVAGNMADIVMAASMFFGGEAAAPVMQGIKEAAGQGIKSTAIATGKALAKESIVGGGGFGLLSGISSGRDITNIKDYINNLWQNVKAGVEIAGVTGTAIHVALPLAKGATAKAGAIFVTDPAGKAKVDQINMSPEVAQATVLHDGKLEKTPTGKAVMKTSLEAQQSGGHVAITPDSKGQYDIPGLGKADIAVTKPYDPQAVDTKTTPYDTPAIVKARAEQASMTSTHTIDTPERHALREAIGEQLYKNGGYADKAKRPTAIVKSEKRADIVMGQPAAGKSTVIADPLVKQHGSVLVDSDEGKKLIPESEGGKYAGATHNESSDINKEVLKKALRNGNNMVIPIVGRSIDTVRELRDALKEEGYTVHLHLNEVSPDEAAKRSVKRFEDTGRFVDPAYVLHDVGLKPSQNYDILKREGGFQSYEKYNNEVAKGEPAKLIERIDNPSGHGIGESTDKGHTGSTAGTAESGNNGKANSSELSSNTKNDQLTTRKVLNTKETQYIQDVIKGQFDHLATTAKNPDEFVQGAEKIYKDISTKAGNDKVVLSALRTRINKEMYDISGSNVGDYKQNYATLQTIIKEDPEMGKIVTRLEAMRNELDEKLLTAQVPEKGTAPTPIKPSSTEKPHPTGVIEPVKNSSDQKVSSAQKHLLERLAETDPERYQAIVDKNGEIKYNVNHAKDDLEHAAKLIEENPQKAYETAMGYRGFPEKGTINALAVMLSDRAAKEGNYGMVADLERSLTLRSTRAGQEIASLRGRNTENSPHGFMQQVLQTRLARLGKTVTTGIRTDVKTMVKEMGSVKERAVAKIDKATLQLQKELRKRQVMIKSAQSILDDLTCK